MSEEDESHIRYLIECLEHCKKGVALTMTTSTSQEYINWLKSLKDRVQPQPKQEWSEEDESTIKEIIEDLEYAERKGYVLKNNTFLKEVHWLKSLKDKVQPKQEWNEEDEGFLNLLLAIFKNSHPNGIFTTGDIAVFNGACITSNKIINWIKSLKDKI